MSKKEYFAYGSNLNFEQMAYRCPEATAVGTAKLDGYELAFRRGYLTVLPKEGASVEGLIWSITDHDESQLDCYEGYPTFYDKETMTVTDADGTPHKIMVYTMNYPPPHPRQERSDARYGVHGFRAAAAPGTGSRRSCA